MEKACGCIVFNKGKVLVEKSLHGFYGFPKGHIEEGETYEECAVRETFEETGIKVFIDPKYSFKVTYLLQEKYPKQVIYFIAFLNGSDQIEIQESEVESACWVDVSKVREMLSFENLKSLWDEVYIKYLEVYCG